MRKPRHPIDYCYVPRGSRSGHSVHHCMIVEYPKYSAKIHVDEYIAPVINACLRLGIATLSSCQAGCGGWCGNHGPKSRAHWRHERKSCKECVWILFRSISGAKRFIRLVSAKSDSRMIKQWTMTSIPNPWRRNSFWCSVVFPRVHLQNVIAATTTALNRTSKKRRK
jgi:hypothetical protein